jgi:hypothetical protein
VAAADGYTTAEDTALCIDPASILDNDTDVDGDQLFAVLLTGASRGQLTLEPDGTFCYLPNSNWYGTDTFTYKANDTELLSGPATVTIVVTPVPDPPVAVDDFFWVNKNESLTVDRPGVLGNDYDVDPGDALQVALVDDVSYGTLSLNPDGSFTYTPVDDFEAVDSFTYVATDGLLTSAPATVELAINQVPKAKVDNISYYRCDDSPFIVDAPGVLENDTDKDGDALTVELVQGVEHGSIELRPDGSFTYRHVPPDSGGDNDEFYYRALDGKGGSDTTKVHILVKKCQS